MNSLSQLRQAGALAPAHPPKQNNAFGVVLSIATAHEVDGNLVLTGTTETQNDQLPANSPVKVTFRGDSGGRAVSNFTKGNGKSSLATPEKAAGTIVTLESCYLTGEQDGDMPVLSARWLNTLAVAGKEDHGNRSFVENILATAPRLIFDNPTRQSGEPSSITLPVNAEKIRARADGDGGAREFTREWAIGKLKDLPAHKKVQVVIDTIEPSESVKVASIEELKAALAVQLARGTKALSMIRVSDGSELATRLSYVPFKTEELDGKKIYLPDVDKAIDELFKYNIVKDVPNEALVEAMQDPGNQIVVEVIPGYRMTWAGDSTKDDNAAYKLINDIKEGKTARYQVLFGKEPTHYAKVILTGLCRNDSIDGFSPMNVMTEESGYRAPGEFGTPHVQPRQAGEPRTEAAQDEEPIDEDAARPAP
ncbi:MAG: hypothetical protein WKF61_00415 [Luteimonas sp.]